MEDEPAGAAQILVMRQQYWERSPWGGQGQGGELVGAPAGEKPWAGEGSPGASCGSALYDPGQVHPLGDLLLCDRRGLIYLNIYLSGLGVIFSQQIEDNVLISNFHC